MNVGPVQNDTFGEGRTDHNEVFDCLYAKRGGWYGLSDGADGMKIRWTVFLDITSSALPGLANTGLGIT